MRTALFRTSLLYAAMSAVAAQAAPIVCFTPVDPVPVTARPAKACVNPQDIPNFVNPLNLPGGVLTSAPANSGLVPDTLVYNVAMKEGAQQMLPLKNAAGVATPFKPSTIWGYTDGNNPAATPAAPGPAVIVNKGIPTQITFNNQLPTVHPLASAQDWGLFSNMPFNSTGFNDPVWNLMFPAGVGAGLDNRVAVHTHGLAASSSSDGASWEFFPNHAPVPLANTVTYSFPNQQNSALYWFHDHAMGQTRLNAYLGLASPYIIRDAANPIDNFFMTAPAGSAQAASELFAVIQDRDFTDATLTTPGKNEQYFEDAPAGPERFGSVWMVNGQTTPFVNVKDHVYRLRLLNGSQARVATLKLHIELGDTATNRQTVAWKPKMYVIGHEQGSDPTLQPAVNSVTIAPGERLDVLVDFRDAGKQLALPRTAAAVPATMKFLLVNTAPAPFPGGVCLPTAGAVANNVGQPIWVAASKTQPVNNCIPQPLWAYTPATGLPAPRATSIAQVMEFRMTRDFTVSATGAVAAAPRTALDTWMNTTNATVQANGQVVPGQFQTNPVTNGTKKIDPNTQTLEQQVRAKYCTGLVLPAGRVCDIPYLVSIGKIKERVFPLYDLPFTNLVLGGPLGLNTAKGELRYGVNIRNTHYQDPGNVNAGFPTAEHVQDTMTAPAGTDIVEEVWTYVNATPDSHPMHEHLFAMQAINREYFDSIRFQNDALGYPASATGWAVGAGAPSTRLPNPLPVDPVTGLPLPLWGDPTLGLASVFNLPAGFIPPEAWVTHLNTVDYRNYVAKNAATGVACGAYTTAVPAATLTCVTGSEAFANNVVGAIVTNTAVATPSNPVALAPEDRNWKDVIVAPPGHITRVLVRTARPDGTSFTAQPAGTTNPSLLFDPKVGTFPMHCHILEHEENDMMTSFEVK